jgi:aminotransferase in exopolysaccharide biosynthesis
MYKKLCKFIREYYDQETGLIPLHSPIFKGNEKKYVLDAIDSTFVSSVGSYVDKLEVEICDYTGSDYAVAIVNGTSALHLSLLLAGVCEGDEVITQPLSFVATSNAISYCKAIPHFVDVDKETLGLSPSILKNYLKQIAHVKNGCCYNLKTGNKISACVPMHTFGLPMYIDEIVEICNQYNINVVEDAAESLGTFYKNKHTGTFGLLGVFSFNGNKIVTAGGGGAIVTNDEKLAKKAKYLSTQAKISHKWEYSHNKIGFNYRMPNINAALLCAQIENLEFFVKNKRFLSDLYCNFFSEYDDITLYRELDEARANYWLNCILLKNEYEKDLFLKTTNDQAIMTRPIWKLLNKLEMYKDCPSTELTNANWLEKRLVNIPSSVC